MIRHSFIIIPAIVLAASGLLAQPQAKNAKKARLVLAQDAKIEKPGW